MVRISDDGSFFCVRQFHFFVGAMYSVTIVKICAMMIEESVSYAYRLLLLLCVAILPFPAAVRHRVPDGQVCC